MKEFIIGAALAPQMAATAIACGLAACAFAALQSAETSLARAAYPHCELRATMPDNSRTVLAMGNPGEDCKDLAARITRQGEFRLPADYRAIWYEIVPGE